MSSGAFAEIIDELSRAGVSCSQASPNLVRCTWRGAHITIVRDDEFVRAQLLDDGGLGVHAWDVIDPILTRASTTRTGLSSDEAYHMFGSDMGLCDVQPCLYTDMDGNPTMYASGRPAGHVGGDPSHDTTGKYLNADGSSSYPNASGLRDAGWDGPSLPTDARKNEVVRARREAAFGRPERVPERVGGFYYDPDLAKFGNAFSPFVQTDSFERANLALQRPFQDRYNPRYDNQPTWAEWMEMGGDEWVGASGSQIASDTRVLDVVDKRALLTTGIIAGLTTLLALNHKKHWLEIAAAGVGGVALVWGMSAGAKSVPSR